MSEVIFVAFTLLCCTAGYWAGLKKGRTEGIRKGYNRGFNVGYKAGGHDHNYYRQGR